jgi:hypothetical protein
VIATDEELHLAWCVYHGDDVVVELVRVAGSIERAQELLNHVLLAAEADVVVRRPRRSRSRRRLAAVSGIPGDVTAAPAQ